MSQKSVAPKSSSERIVKDIRRATRKQYSAEEKIRIVLGLSVGEALQSIGVSETTYYRWRSDYGGLTRTLRSSCGPSTTKH
jgi:transposase